VAWLLKIETDSILIKEKRKHLSKTLDRVSKLMKRKRLKFGLRESSHRSIYRYTKFIRYRIIAPVATMDLTKVVLIRLGIYLFVNKARGGGSPKFFIHTL